MKSSFWTLSRVTGIALMLGCALFLAGASIPLADSNGTFIYQLPPQQWLGVVSANAALWYWINVLFVGGTLFTLAGLALLTALLQVSGGWVLSQLGLMAFAFGALLWIVDVSLRLGVDSWAAQETVRTGAMPEYYAPLTLWTHVLFMIFTMLAFSAMAAFGAAALISRLLPRWLGWTMIVYTMAGLGLLAYAHDFPPFAHYLLLLVIGGLLFLRRNQRSAATGTREVLATAVSRAAR